MFSTDNLQAGDRVVVVISDTFSGIGKYIGTVIKKTPSGMVDVVVLCPDIKEMGRSMVRGIGIVGGESI